MKLERFGTLSEKANGDGMLYSGFKVIQESTDPPGMCYLEKLHTLIKKRLDKDLAKYKMRCAIKGIDP